MRKSNALEGILSLEDIRNPYLLAGLAGTIATSVSLDSLAAKTVDRVIHTTVLPKVSKKDVEYRPSELWHGTGKYKYNGEKVIDVLAEIACEGYILPNPDKFDMTRSMVSVSLAKSRMYARAYADMHGAGADEKDRYGSSLFWACSFLGSVAVEASKEERVWRPSGYYKMLGHLATANAVEWYKNITRVPNPSVVSVYQNGSDIHDNYPILFGIKGANPTNTSSAVALHEIRTEDALDIVRDVSHVEVPYRCVEETRRILRGIAVVPIELGEQYSSGYSFSEHMHGSV